MYNFPTTISGYEATCIICSSTIRPGERKFCFVPETNTSADVNVNPNNEKPRLAWGHASCYHPNIPPPPPCRHWARLGRCPSLQADMCAFLHDTQDKSTSTAKTSWGGKRRFIRNQHKNSVFRIFLMQTYGMEYLTQNKDATIIDVAGGKGELSWELINLTGVNSCVVIDPRPLNLQLIQSKWKKGMFEPKRTGYVFSKWYPACEEGCSTSREPRDPFHLRCFFDAVKFVDFVNSDDVQTNNHTWFREEIDRAKQIVWTTKGLQHEDGSNYNEESETVPMSHYESIQTANSTNNTVDYDTNIVDPTKAQELLNKCNLIIGLHPDQAAGEIVEYALSKRIPWCIVPCCVYSQCFTKRKLKNGSLVKSYDDLVKWLCERDPRACVATLDIEGKNKVVYTLPDKTSNSNKQV